MMAQRRAVATISGGLDSLLAARLTARFGQGRDARSVTVTATDRQGHSRILDVHPMSSSDIPRDWYV